MVANSGADAFQFRLFLALCQHRLPAGGTERYPAAQRHGGYARFQYDELHGDAHLRRLRRIRTAQGSAEGVLLLAENEEESHLTRQGAGHTDRYSRYAETQHHLCAQLRQQCPRQQRGESAQRLPVCLLHRASDRFDVHVGLYGGCLQKGQREEDAHLFLRCGRFGLHARTVPAALRSPAARLVAGVRFDGVQCAALRDRPGGE